MNKEGFKNFGMSMLVYLGISLGSSFIVGFLIELLNIQNLFVTNIMMAFSTLLTFVGVFFFSYSKLKGQFEKFKSNFKSFMSSSLKTWILGLLIMFIVNFVLNVVILKSIAPNEEANRELLDSYLFYSLISMCVFGPLTEEMVFRLNLDGTFKSKKAFIIVSGLIFGLMHILTSEITLANILYIIPYSVLGCTFAKIYKDTDNIYSSIFMHILHNIISITIILFGI